ncbi:hypothetical protein vBBcePLY3_00025 [Bacillus phage vB_BceP_LY3]|uniref:Uncharacterized protein n=1 Tax=Bacillus phage vB_BceP_LY3 TaxID=2950458 RepID=A0AAE9LV66_9CAUD|nr:hypothetical protein vBBcePLY3_00025 [Bacillus phage vB_BceP_LY3]
MKTLIVFENIYSKARYEFEIDDTKDLHNYMMYYYRSNCICVSFKEVKQ